MKGTIALLVVLFFKAWMAYSSTYEWYTVDYRITWLCSGCQVDIINETDKGMNGHVNKDSFGNAVAWPTQWIETDRVK